LYAIHSDLSPNLSPKRREALNFTPLPLQGRGWGLGLYWNQLRRAIKISAIFSGAEWENETDNWLNANLLTSLAVWQ